MLRFVKIALVLALPACASAQGADRPAVAPARMEGHMAYAVTPPGTRIVVAAMGTASRAPEQAVINLAIETAGRSAREAADQNADVMDRIIEALRRLQIPEDQIRTTAYNIYPEYRHYDGRDPEMAERQPEIIGYRVMNTVTVTVDGASRAGGVIDAALGAGANRIDGLFFQLDPEDAEAVRADALRDAMSAARSEALLLAEAAGLTLGPPVEISTSYGHYPPPPPMPMAAMARDAAEVMAPTPVQPGTVEVQATVNVIYSAQ